MFTFHGLKVKIFLPKNGVLGVPKTPHNTTYTPMYKHVHLGFLGLDTWRFHNLEHNRTSTLDDVRG